jgi:YD repeat-containing protein
VQSLAYDTQGHLLTAAWGGPDGPIRETIYTYDAQGRLIGITGEGEWSTAFEYHDQGRKTRIIRSELKASSSSTDNRARGVQIENENAGLFVFPPVGGLVKTLFNEHDQPLESQVYAASGDLTSRLTRTYDALGRVSESSYVIVLSGRFETRDLSTNSWWVALLSFGQGWHNNHHAHPVSARHGLAWHEISTGTASG